METIDYVRERDLEVLSRITRTGARWGLVCAVAMLTQGLLQAAWRATGSVKLTFKPAVFALLCALFIVTPVYGEPRPSEREARLEADGYAYVYQSIPVRHPTTKELMYHAGRIVVSKIKDQHIVYEENDTLESGCDEFPPISKLQVKLSASKLLGGDPKKERTLVILCGNSSGRHQTIKIFFAAPVTLKVTTLDFENTRPNISDIRGDGVYESNVHRRIVFDGAGEVGVTPYLFVYALHIDSSTFGFSPQFGPRAAQRYLDYYRRLISSSKGEIPSDYIGPMIGALFATNSKDSICREVEMLTKKGVPSGKIFEWSTRVLDAGYPYFDLNMCKGK